MKKKLNTYGLDLENLPKHIAIIMDGNGRWAKKRGLPRSAGHARGAENLRHITHFCYDIGVKALTLYAFSTENWNRPLQEVTALMDLFAENLNHYVELMGDRQAEVRFIGEKDRLGDKLKQKMLEVEAYSRQFKDSGFVLNFAINYGSRDEILRAAKQIAQDYKNEKISLDEIDVSLFSEHLYTHGVPDPDLLIRPSGEQRISNFLLWQCAYTEFYYSDILWPDFKAKNLADAIKEYQKRNRRFGKV